MAALLGVANTVVVAYLYGVGREVEVYLAAVGLHASIMSMAQTGQVAEVLLPTYHRVRAGHGRDEAFRAFSGIVNRVLLALLCVAILAWWLAPLLAGLRVPGFSATEVGLAASMFRWILPLVLIQVATEMLRTISNAESLFGAPETVGLLARVASLVSIVALASHLQAWALVAALWVASIVEIVGMLWVLNRAGFKHSLTLRISEDASRFRFFSKVGSTVPYVLATQVFLFVLDAALSMLPQGSFAVFRYVSTVWSRVQGVFLRPVTIPFFTGFSEAAEGQGAVLTALSSEAFGRMLAVTAVVGTAVLSGGQLVLAGVWAGPKFPLERITEASWLLSGMFLLLPVVGAAVLFRKLAISLGAVRSAYLALATAQLTSALIAWFVVRSAGLTGAYIANAWNVAAFLIGPWIAVRIAARDQALTVRFPWVRLWKWAIAMTLGVGLAQVFRYSMGISPEDAPTARLATIVAGGVAMAIGAVATFAVAAALKVQECTGLVAVASRRIWNR